MSTTSERLAAAVRRKAILQLLFFAPGRVLTVPRLVRQLEEQHSQIVPTLKVRTDLQAMEMQGYVKTVEDATTLTEEGRDVALDRVDIVV